MSLLWRVSSYNNAAYRIQYNFVSLCGEFNCASQFAQPVFMIPKQRQIEYAVFQLSYIPNVHIFFVP